ncbi:MAG: GntR family transcriptional regulator [Eubacteriaceae bacterium]|nr:GntR family transcriptional regulator [Eubacteriaceae bacterium]
MYFKDDDTFKKFELNREMPIPLYYQIAQLIREEIKSGELKPGDKILTEEKLQEKFDVSRATVRKAISDLVNDGLLEKKPSKGTIVSVPKVEEKMYGVMSFTNATLKSNKSLKTKIIEFKEITNNPEVCEKLQIDKNEKVNYIKRVRYIDGEPIAVEDWYAPSKFLPDLTIDQFAENGIGQSSYYLIQNVYNIKLSSIHDIMSAVALEQNEAKILDTFKGTPALLRQRITYNENNIPIVYSCGRYLIKISIDFHANKDIEQF